MNKPITYRNEYPTVPGWYWVYSEYNTIYEGSETAPPEVACEEFTQRDINRVAAFVDPPSRAGYWYAGPLPITPPQRPEGTR
jgi:hypothetical protein